MKEGKRHWGKAVELLCKWENGVAHLDDLLEGADLGEVRWLVMETFRQWLLVEHLLEARIQRLPRPMLHQLLRLALAECLARGPELHPRIVHHAVAIARSLGLSAGEQGFLNAVLRTILREGDIKKPVPVERSHPGWMVARWTEQFGEAACHELIRWNQALPVLTVYAADCPSYGEPTQWPGYFLISRAAFAEALPDLQAGRAYVQDPFARIPVELLDPRPGETVLDLCAAPGGKTRLIAERMRGKGQLVAVDKPGRRLARLQENASRLPSGRVQVVGRCIEDLTAADVRSARGAGADAVLIDVPCSNTGVIRKRPDVKLRLSEADILQVRQQQLELLGQAAGWVRPGGRLVYSTCSLEKEENEGVVEAFCRENAGWEVDRSILSRPWECGHDGGGAFLLTRHQGR